MSDTGSLRAEVAAAFDVGTWLFSTVAALVGFVVGLEAVGSTPGAVAAAFLAAAAATLLGRLDAPTPASLDDRLAGKTAVLVGAVVAGGLAIARPLAGIVVAVACYLTVWLRSFVPTAAPDR